MPTTVNLFCNRVQGLMDSDPKVDSDLRELLFTDGAPVSWADLDAMDAVAICEYLLKQDLLQQVFD